MGQERCGLQPGLAVLVFGDQIDEAAVIDGGNAFHDAIAHAARVEIRRQGIDLEAGQRLAQLAFGRVAAGGGIDGILDQQDGAAIAPRAGRNPACCVRGTIY
jgi:hypothetical protein